MIPSDFSVQSPIDNYAELCKNTPGRSAQTLVLESSILTCCSLTHPLSFICVCVYIYIHTQKIRERKGRYTLIFALPVSFITNPLCGLSEKAVGQRTLFLPVLHRTVYVQSGHRIFRTTLSPGFLMDEVLQS